MKYTMHDPEDEPTEDELFDRWAETFDSDAAADEDYWASRDREV